MRRTIRPSRFGWTGLLAAVVLQGVLVSPSAAQEDIEPGLELTPIPSDQVAGPIPVPDGAYSGSLGFSGQFSFAADGVEVLWVGEGAGSISFTVVDSALSGTWTMSGNSTALIAGAPVSGNAVSFWTNNGDITAQGAGPYVMTSEPAIGETTATVTAPTVGTRTQTESYEIPAATVQLDRLVEVCGQISGTWDQTLAAGLEQLPGAVGTLRSYLTALPAGLSEFQERVDQLFADAAALAGDLGDPDNAVAGMYVLVERAEDLLEEMGPQDLPCDLDSSFMRIITLQMQDVLHTYLINWDDLAESSLERVPLLREMLIVGTRAGAIGSGSVDSVAAATIEGLAADIAQEAFTELSLAEPTEATLDTANDLAAIGVILGITYQTPEGSEITPQEICLGLGGCS